ncbi:hypothetical protein SUDANB21_04415 [Streptomyces sp. enrichment culture]
MKGGPTRAGAFPLGGQKPDLVFPEDYLTVMRKFPGGVIAGMRVFPVVRAAWLAEDPVFLQGGELEGKAFGWLALTSDPQEWRVAYIEPGGTSLTHLGSRPSPRSSDVGCGATTRRRRRTARPPTSSTSAFPARY